jgi:hypothetical protein
MDDVGVCQVIGRDQVLHGDAMGQGDDEDVVAGLHGVEIAGSGRGRSMDAGNGRVAGLKVLWSHFARETGRAGQRWIAEEKKGNG